MAAAIAAALLVVACGGGKSPEPVVQHVAMKLTDSSAGFGLRLADGLLAEPNAGNVFISPLSATLVLSMAASAAQGDTRAAMLQMLGLDPTAEPAVEARQTIERLAQSDASAQLELAQAVWVQNGLVLDPAYASKLSKDYKAQIANLDFHDRNAPDVVNRWVDGATHHKITRLVDSFDPSIVGYLVNATYFHALWRIEFDSHGTANFHKFTGDVTQLPMMQRSEDVTVLSTPDYQATLLPYKGGRFSALVLLPRQTLPPSGFGGFLTLAKWNEVLRDLHGATGSSLGGTCAEPNRAVGPNIAIDCQGTLDMPKFTVGYKKDLTHTLVAMGMPRDPALAAFCGGCFLSDVVQKTYLQVDEKGTTAAAATGGAVATAAHIPVVVDHPFAFALIDNATDAPLFLGAIGDL